MSDIRVRPRQGRNAEGAGRRGSRSLQSLAGFGLLDIARDDAAMRAGPLMRASSMPASLARRRASGEENMRARPSACGAGAAAGAAGTGAAFARAAAGPAAAGACADRCSLRRRACGPCPGRLHVLAVAGQHRNHVVDRDILRALRHQDPRNRALIDRLDLHGRLVGLDLRDDVAGLYLVALFLEPLGKVALFHRRRQRRHQNVDWHCQ